MTAPTPYVTFPGNARAALTHYARVFGGEVELHSFADFGRDDGPPDAIAHGQLVDGPVRLFAADAADGQAAVHCDGLLLSLLGTAAPSVLREWFARLSDGGRVLDDLQPRPWGASDGHVVDRFGLRWLIGYEHD